MYTTVYTRLIWKVHTHYICASGCKRLTLVVLKYVYVSSKFILFHFYVCFVCFDNNHYITNVDIHCKIRSIQMHFSNCCHCSRKHEIRSQNRLWLDNMLFLSPCSSKLTTVKFQSIKILTLLLFNHHNRIHLATFPKILK